MPDRGASHFGGGVFVGTCAQGQVSIWLDYALDDRRIGIGLVAVNRDTSQTVFKSIKTDCGTHSISCTMGTGHTMAQAVNHRHPSMQGQAFLRVFRFFPVCIVPPLLHTHVQRSLMDVCEEAILGREQENIGQKRTFISVTGWCFPKSKAHLA